MRSHLGTIIPNLKQSLFFQNDACMVSEMKSSIELRIWFSSFCYYYFTKYLICIYCHKMPKSCVIIPILYFYDRFEDCLDCYPLLKIHEHNLRQSSSVL